MCLDDRITKAVKKMGFEHPTLIQAKAVPLSLQGKDILAKARTGSGKTAAYSIPIVQKILMAKSVKGFSKGVRAVVLVPTRELCEQVRNHFLQVCYYCMPIVSVVQLGGDQSEAEQRGLLRDIPDVIISTPTRLVTHLKARSVVLESSLEMLVIDEADLVLSYGYQEDINFIKTALPKVCQGFLMSATLTPQVEELKKLILHTPAILRLEEDHAEKANLSEYSIKCSNMDKFLLVFSLLRLKLMQGKILFFVNDTNNCYKLKLFLERFHIKAAVLNSELPINSRHHIILQFNKGMFDYLIATDESFRQTAVELNDDEEEDVDVKEEELEDDDDEQEDDEEEIDVDEQESGDDEEIEVKEEKVTDDEQEDDDEDEEDEEDEESEIQVKEEKDSDDDEDDAANEDDFFNNKDDDEEQEAEDDEETKPVPKVKHEKKTKYTDTEYGVARGIDFRNVDIVVNFDFPRSVKNYIHRIGRTARGNNKGIGLSFITDDNNDLLSKVQKERGQSGYHLKPFEFKMNAIEGFRYRVEDVINTISKKEVAAARKKELELEIINSAKLKSHFEANPKDLEALKHDVPLLKRKVAKNLRIIPDYLLPEAMKSSANSRLQVIRRERPANSNNNSAATKKKNDILSNFHKKKNQQKQQKQFEQQSKKRADPDQLVRQYQIKENDVNSSGGLKSTKKLKLNK
ncbi:hypothetical protein SAMD00019534_107400 [Acytostelium subglobosum LB1]|uniref:hypothetical protein n=1 Tax=Acytostelium subglobosum LB1 TaxID=1410327 RepID=UPI000644CE03|nr:hypothetical protein SAMD00019534_107400 [Acytostelium subglobosum LB1]GAM27564.1 hypothetical protein SAMD00019534_107400 [Acytostelium subglobosum LB1]|eukprot:XP_012749629.1 hypothetical protein SAMD00019534_107400 [Acytostelium subglobosum LB1]